ncbi:MAG: hypothetical protein E7C82_02685 [Anaerococcus hydrogenalis]|uniref:hypothetical protein n=1 Tax=Anaerococcus hydrogenalis TaxID=33029 RepID=UPI0029048905|nr:hypothetical protein [Anaerococcus hydrogenalis]MDU2582589.1 hypothetical protein [Anaerococcus hydrogenalis]
MEILKIILPLFLLGICIVFLIKKLDKKNKKLEGENSKNDENYLAEGIGLGLVFGAALGSVFDNIAYWISLGMLFGLIIGQAIKKEV